MKSEVNSEETSGIKNIALETTKGVALFGGGSALGMKGLALGFSKLGFTTGGIAKASYAAKWMGTIALKSGCGVKAGSLLAIC